ncbi:MAG: FMN-binding negative transcriptional regulator [Burkholderiales bacterium]|nr:FMN-binding negative transcriptional regulator [Burkholderiales bacterium]
MYLPPHFTQPDPDAARALIATHPLGALVRNGSDGLDADHLPFLFDREGGPHGRLVAHVARANPLWREVHDGEPVLVIFRGAQAYVSPNWYPSKHEAHRQVPTWNYQIVHVHGTIVVHDDVRYVRGVVARLTREHEARTGAVRPWKMGDAPPAYIDEMLDKIVGIEVAITRLTAKWKLSQNKDERDRRGAIQALREQGEDPVADAIEATLATSR